MVIYVVMPGDSVYSIAARYGVSQAKIIEENGLDQIPHLVVGQSLVIPSSERAHFVVPGESIWSISQKYGSSEESIMELNGIKGGGMLFPGMVIRVPERAKKYGVIETNAFIQPSTEEHEKSVVGEAAPDLTYISPFSHHVNADGSLTPLMVDTIIATAKQYKAVPMLSVTNLTESNFSTNLIDSILKSESLQQTVINNIKALISQGNYYGVIIDFERISPENRELYNNFLRKLAAEIHSMGKLLATALAPKNYDIKEGSWHGAHDYKAHGGIVDFVVIMTYEWGWSGGAAQLKQ